MRLHETKPSELAALLPLAENFEGQSGLFHVEPVRWISFYRRALQVGSAIVLHATNGSPEPVGAIGGVLNTSPNDGVLQLHEGFWYVDKEHRGCGQRLRRSFERIARERGAERVWMIALADENERVMSRMYKHSGYKRAETLFLKEV